MGTATSAAFFLSSALTPASCLPIIMSNLPCIQGKDPDSTACAAKAAAGGTTARPGDADEHTRLLSVKYLTGMVFVWQILIHADVEDHD